MRMWKVNPKNMCRKHLLGEHVEMHMFIGVINKGKSLAGYINTGLVEIDQIIIRHNELVEEMKNRGYNHKSPINIDYKLPSLGQVNILSNEKELKHRCKDCKF